MSQIKKLYKKNKYHCCMFCGDMETRFGYPEHATICCEQCWQELCNGSFILGDEFSPIFYRSIISISEGEYI